MENIYNFGTLIENCVTFSKAINDALLACDSVARRNSKLASSICSADVPSRFIFLPLIASQTTQAEKRSEFNHLDLRFLSPEAKNLMVSKTSGKL